MKEGEYRSRSARRRRLKSTQVSVDLNKARAQQEFMEHRARLARHDQTTPEGTAEKLKEKDKCPQISIRKRRQATRPQSSAPAAQLSRRRQRAERNGKRASVAASKLQHSDQKQLELHDLGRSSKECFSVQSAHQHESQSRIEVKKEILSSREKAEREGPQTELKRPDHGES